MYTCLLDVAALDRDAGLAVLSTLGGKSGAVPYKPSLEFLTEPLFSLELCGLVKCPWTLLLCLL